MSINKYTVAKRSVWYVLRTMLVITIVIVLCLTAFVTAMHMSSIYILVTEGLEFRAGCILQEGDVNELREYFTGDFVDKDGALYDGRYLHFNVTNFLYKLEVRGISILPGSDHASMKVYEKMMSISATPNDDAPEGIELPQWTPAIYSVELDNLDGRWYISDMILLESSPAEKPLPTPDLSRLPQEE